MKRFFSVFFVFCILFVGHFVEAQSNVPQIPTWQTQLESILNQAQSPWIVSIVLLLIEMTMRLVKTQDPKSLLYIISNGLKLVAKLLDTVSQFVDQYIQRLK